MILMSGCRGKKVGVVKLGVRHDTDVGEQSGGGSG